MAQHARQITAHTAQPSAHSARSARSAHLVPVHGALGVQPDGGYGGEHALHITHLRRREPHASEDLVPPLGPELLEL